MRSKQRQTGDLVAISIYVPRKLHGRVEKLAQAEGRTLSSQVVRLIEKALESTSR